MTLSTSTGTTPTVGEIIADAYRTAGLVEVSQMPSAPQMSFGRRKLQRLLDGLQTQGVFSRSVRLHDLALTEGQSVYTLPAWASDVEGTGAYIQEGQDAEFPDSTLPVRPMSREQFQQLSDHGSLGPPTQYWMQEDVEPRKIHIWPRPTDSGLIRLQVRRHLAAIENDEVTIDLERYWMRHLEYALVAELAPTPTTRQEYRMEANAQLEKARSEANESVTVQFYLDHPV